MYNKLMALALSGFFLLVLVLVDALWTTLAPRGGGPVTKRIARAWWTASLWLHRRRPHGARGLLGFAGPALIVVVFLVLVIGLWAGWLMVFSADPAAIVSSSSRVPAALAERIYYVGFTLFTLGNGDYVPVGGRWAVLTALASLNGLFVVTLAITYLVPIVSAVASKRQLAAIINDLGASPVELVCGAWDGSGFEGLDQHLTALVSSIEGHTQRHLAYPILHYFQSENPRTSLAVSIAVLDEALLLLAEGLTPTVRLAPAVIEPTRRAINGLLDTLNDAFISPAAQTPAPPDLAALASAGIPTVAVPDFGRVVAGLEARRRLLSGLVTDAGRCWNGMREDG